MDAQTAIGDVIDKDCRRREQIFTVYEDIKKLLQRDENLRHILTTEIGDVTQDLDKLRCAITDTECPILVAGETSAGKSSIINLIIGTQILPERLLFSTSTICKIWNSEEKKIVLTDLKNKQKNTPIVDTPGIGTRETLMERLFDYLPNAMAFIYVINSGNAGGVEYDDWYLIDENIEYCSSKEYCRPYLNNTKGNMLDFDTETTLFVCNKWDQVDEDEEEAVWDFIKRKLESDWPQINLDQQLFKLSCKKEKKRIRNKSQPSSNYEKLVQGIRDMLPKTLEAKLIRHVKESVLAKVDEKCKAIALEIVDHLNSVKEDMFMWKQSDLPESKDILCVTAKATELIQATMNNEINKWRLRKTHEIDNEMKDILTRHFNIIEGDLRIASDCFGSFTGYTSEYMHMWNTLSLLTKHFNLGIGAAIVTSPLLFCGIFGINLYVKEMIPGVQNYDSKNKSAIQNYTTDKTKFMRKLADSILEKQITEKQIYTQMGPFMKT
ncbi:unnamed protein product [Mytilus edulis]|uniref:Dynamin N-terminal domain-containing protein n=1 Tax=Mytilus edulis TaxID=6550 RepID=A0A8S3VBI4_MYTED|nr:unnamed protein product [Mytilus edulis]